MYPVIQNVHKTNVKCKVQIVIQFYFVIMNYTFELQLIYKRF